MTSMNKSEAKKKAIKLRELLNLYDYQYYVLDHPTVSDAVYDSLMLKLQEIESSFPDLVTKESPTQRVSGQPAKKFAKVRHLKQMLSLNDVFNLQELFAWQERIKKLTGQKKLDYFCELKIDGLSIMLTYQDGLLLRGATRGDGITGEDVTTNLKTIGAIPLKLREEKGRIDARGEVFMSNESFKKINQEQQKLGLPAYANPRNLAAGSVRQLDPKITADRKLDCYIYDLYMELGAKTHHQKHQILAELGFKTSQYVKKCSSLDQVIEYIKFWENKRQTLDFQVDGLVIIVDNNEFFEALGAVGKAPRGAVAYKFAAEQATTQLLDIRVNVGRTGAITPYAVMTPVKIAGSIVSRATLHNEEEIKRKDLLIGDTVVIQKAGDIIPEVIKSVKDLRTGQEKTFHFPDKCPACGSQIIKPANEVVARCINPNCFAVEKEKLNHFVSKDAFDIEGLGPQIMEQLLEAGLISDVADLFFLKEGDIRPLERFADKSAVKLIEAINRKKMVSLARFIYALGIRHVGAVTATDLASSFGDLEKISRAKKEDLQELPGIGEVVAVSISQWFKDKKNQQLLKKLQSAEVTYQSERSGSRLRGISFVITGSLRSLSRGQAEEQIRLLGGKASSSVSKDTDYLVLGENPGQKYQQALELGIKIISEGEFIKFL